MSTSIKPPRSGHDVDNRYPVSVLEPPMSECLTAILQSLKTMKEGDFSVRLPVSWTGLPGKIADNFNDIVKTSGVDGLIKTLIDKNKAPSAK